jgi:hypothetical protein
MVIAKYHEIAMKVLLLHITLCISVKLDTLSFSFRFISFLTNGLYDLVMVLKACIEKQSST